MAEQGIIEELEECIVDWAHERGIMAQSDPQAQIGKTLEEVAELFQAIRGADLPAVEDGVGDIVVTLIIISHMFELNLQACLSHAWNEIKDRKGRMNGGVFEKEGEDGTQ